MNKYHIAVILEKLMVKKFPAIYTCLVNISIYPMQSIEIYIQNNVSIICSSLHSN
jgi:hypothetical protein